MTKKDYCITLDVEVVAEVDKVRGLVNRSTWINDLLRRDLRILP